MAFSGAPRPRATLLPFAPDRYERGWMQRALDMIGTASEATVKKTEASPHVLLLSPSAKVFRVSVTDAGTLSIVEVPQGDRLA